MEQTTAQDQPITENQPVENGQPESWIGTDGKFNLENAPEEFKGVLESKKWGDVGDVLKSYTNLEKLKGTPPEKVLTIPDSDDPEEWSKVYDKLGRPESPDKYEFKAPEGMPEVDDALLGDFKKFAHDKGLSDRQFQDLVNYQLELANQYQQETQAQIEASKESLRGQFKTEDEYNEYTKTAMDTAEKIGLWDVIEKNGLQYDPDAIKALNSLSKSLSEDSIPNAPQNTEVSREQRIEEIKQSDAFKQRLHPKHQETMAEYHRLFGISR